MSAARPFLALAAALAALPVRAQDGTVVTSPRADSLAVTIYRDDLALVTETRTVDLPAGAVTLVIDGVVETLLPQSAVLADAGRPLAESNFDFDQLTPRTLLERSIGETVTITRTNPATGRVTRTPATILAVGEGVVLQTVEGNEALYCSGLPERLELARLPDELVAKPRLSVKLAAGEPGPRTVKVTYLAHGFAWSSDYVAHLNERSDGMTLAGWATLTNSTGSAFEQAEVQLVAGKLNILDAEDGGSAAEPVDTEEGETETDARVRELQEEALDDVAMLRKCFATQGPLSQLVESVRSRVAMYDRAAFAPQGALEEVVVTGSRIVREEFADYQLYRLPWLTDLGARQTKQVLFLDEPKVRVERFYGFRLESLREGPDEDVSIPSLTLRFENTEAFGLGEPLPSGVVRVFESYGGRDVFAGEADMNDRPVGLPVELEIGRALNVMVEVTTDYDYVGRNSDRIVTTTEHRIVNNKDVPVELEIRQGADYDLTDVELKKSSRRMRRKYGDLAWHFAVPPGEQVLRYEISAREPD
ncbi:MAG TPA: hypothetical protein VF405_03070 [Gammaproteobacteria bacterium]